ncbi:VIT family-domain-containing protein [Mrakia frigida]|uniref:Ccc1p n=1 Tax=Mrakia frigida TaxID=29902 RepID=UPI003FCC08E3
MSCSKGTDCCKGGNNASTSTSSTETTPLLSSNAAPQSLPKRQSHANGNSLWPVRSPSPTPSLLQDILRNAENEDDPLVTKCDAGPGSVCCRDLKGDDERTLIDPDIVRDIVIGLSDGLTVPFALTAGLSGLGNSRIVVLGGLAELIAGAISMGIGGFLASQAELDHFHYLRKQTHARVLRSCNGEMEREVHGVLGAVGVEEPLSRLVAESLLKVEADQAEACDWDDAQEGTSKWWKMGFGGGKKEEEGAGGVRWSKDVGVTGFLMKFGEGLEEVPMSRLYISAFTIGFSYFLGGLCPLLPYFFVDQVETGLIWSSVLTLIILLIFGVAKTYFSGAAGGAGGYAWGAVSTMLVGGIAAAAAFGCVRLLEV